MSIRHILALLLAAIAAAASAATYTPDQVPNFQLQDSTRLVMNPDGILSPQAEQRINNQLRRLRSQSTCEVSVVVIEKMAPGWEVDQFARAVGEQWGVGDKDIDNGVIMLVSRDDRRVSIQTGYGAEEALPDILASQIIRHNITPAFREGDYDKGVEDGVEMISEALTNPRFAESLRAEQRSREDVDFMSFLWTYLCMAACLALAMMIYVWWVAARNSRRYDDFDQYQRLDKLRPVYLALSIFGVGIPLLAYLLLKNKMHTVREHERKCPNCGTMMQKLDEETDNRYLTPAQDAEERLDSVDYDVWLCPNCRETDIIPYPNKSKNFVECPNCHGRTALMVSNRILRQPTERSEGTGVRTYSCQNCHHRHDKQYRIAKIAAATPVIIPGRGFGGGGGGGFGGGGFGGGSFGGGGASGSW